MERLAGALEGKADQLGEKVYAMNTREAGVDLTRGRGHAALVDELVGHLRGLLAEMVRLGIAQQHLQLERDKARLMGVAATEGLDAIGASPEQREVFVRVFLQRLRVAEDQEVTA